MVDGIVFGTCTVAGLLVTALCTRRALGNARVSTWAIALAFGVCTLGVLCAVPAVADALQDVTGLHNAGKLVAHICAVLWCAFLQITMVDLAYRPEYLKAAMFQRGFAAAVELAILVPLFVATNRPDVEFTTEYVDDPKVAAYLLIYLSYVLVTCAELAFMCGRTARRNWGIRPWSSAGFALSSVSAAFGLAYAFSKGSYIIFYTLDSPWALKAEEVVSPTLSGLAVLFLFSGLTLPMVGTLRERLRQKKALAED
ncbi:hypothetical protein QCN29_23130 [Streptomyces sp. HNM0663]|uniref:Integral membrane protein n=1 Tax=Streptomyces chengmaiensis TaxID=3040919 RepID=A0ABT6HSE5_9ACTN|nr:hypothetical protein [Streptomyces chengmaiensis]MDH2391619.1 hypothetical protein [Streptomyces chengmaiensis]